MQKATIGLSIHRPEMIPIMAELIQGHDALLLEEPPASGFQQMLEGTLSVDDYLLPIDVEYPNFSQRMCSLLRGFQKTGKKVVQVEPYIEILLSIHEFFAEGHGPEELPKNSIQYPVYLAERDATGALLAYYQKARDGSFEQTIESIIKFARMDAARLRLRDSLRAQALGSLIEKHPSSYIEAGVIHYQLWQLLRRLLPRSIRVRPVFLADFALKALGEEINLLGPGDQLTLLFIFHPTLTETKQHQLLAARSIIYSKIIEKEELTDDLNTFPHLRDELACIRTTNQFSLDDCRRLFRIIRQAKSSDARQIVAEYLAAFKPQIRKFGKPSEYRQLWGII